MCNAAPLYNQYIQTAILCLGTRAVCGYFLKSIFFFFYSSQVVLRQIVCKLHGNAIPLALVLVAGFHYVYLMKVFANVILKSESRSSLSSHPNEVSYLGLDIFKVKLATVVLDLYQVLLLRPVG